MVTPMLNEVIKKEQMYEICVYQYAIIEMLSNVYKFCAKFKQIRNPLN